MPASGTFAPISFWMDGVSGGAGPLAGEVEADVAVVGAGLSGLSTALALRAEGLSVVVLERDVAGAGASGRSCGQVAAELGKNLPTLRWQLGLERARQVTAVLRAAIANLEALIRTHRIDCAYVPSGNILAGVHPRQVRFFERAARTAEELGIPVRLLAARDLRDMGIPPSIVCGYHEGLGGSLDPGRYTRGLREAALAAGAQLFERSPVERIDEGPTLRVRTSRGAVRCRQCVVATNAYSPHLGWLRRAVMPVAVSVIVTEPLTAAQRARLGWEGREPVYTAHHVLENLRWTHDGRILVGTKRAAAGFGGRFAWNDSPRVFGILESLLRERFPELDDVRVARRWTGHVALTLDFLPVFGRTGRHGNVFYAAGYSGHGLSMASYAGHILRDLILGRDPGPARALVDRFVPPVPPEPFRWLLGQAIRRTLEGLDDRLDAAARRMRAGLPARGGSPAPAPARATEPPTRSASVRRAPS